MTITTQCTQWAGLALLAAATLLLGGCTRAQLFVTSAHNLQRRHKND